MFCTNCGKEVKEDAAFCPECGAVLHPSAQQQTPNAAQSSAPVKAQTESKAQYNILAILGLVISGISVFVNLLGIVGIAGTVLSVLGLLNCKSKGEGGRALAIAGIVVGGISILDAFGNML